MDTEARTSDGCTTVSIVVEWECNLLSVLIWGGGGEFRNKKGVMSRE